MTPIPKLGENVELGLHDEVAVPVNIRNNQPDELCYTWSEVKLHQLTNSELEKYLGKVDDISNQNRSMKGDNKENVLIQTNDTPSSQPVVSRSGRLLHRTVTKPTYVDAVDILSDDEVQKVDNKRNLSKPSSSASRIAAQKRRTVSPTLGVKPKTGYKCSASLSYSISSSGVSTCCSQHTDNDSDSDATFAGFEPLSKDDQNKLSKLRKLETVEYGLKKRNRIRSYICHEGGCTFIGKAIWELNEHHIKMHQNVVCKVCNKSFKTPSSLQRHSYSHEELKFPCDQCEEAFAFNSELRFHKTVHCTIPTFKCMLKNCGKTYKSENELNKHVLKHSGMVWDCDAKNCTYSTDDRRNLQAHKRKHANTGSFTCEPCMKHFKYFMQLKHHRLKPECKAKRAI